MVVGLDIFSKAKSDEPFLIRSHVFNQFPNTKSSLEESNIFQRRGSYDRDKFVFTDFILKRDSKVLKQGLIGWSKADGQDG